MKRNKLILLGVTLGLTLVSISCKKNKCAQCHYDTSSGEVDLGEKCGDEIDNLEQNGYTTGGQTYTVHCGDGH